MSLAANPAISVDKQVWRTSRIQMLYGGGLFLTPYHVEGRMNFISANEVSLQKPLLWIKPMY